MAIYTNSIYRGHGKLLLTAEYFVLDGALALALPCRQGQSLHIQSERKTEGRLYWQSKNSDGEIWFDAIFDLKTLRCISLGQEAISNRLEQIFSAIRQIQPGFLPSGPSFRVETALDFPREWGLGSSSTLIATMAQWAGVDPYDLLEATFGGSGYDIACATATGPIFYQKTADGPKVKSSDFDPDFRDGLFFIYLGQKQNSREGIAHYRSKKQETASWIPKITELSKALAQSKTLAEFSHLIDQHEAIIGDFIEMQSIKAKRFSDYWGSVKSLGAWGGDFALFTSNRSEEETRAYCNEKGLQVFYKYKDLIL